MPHASHAARGSWRRASTLTLTLTLTFILGTKHVRLFAPSETFNLYPYPVGHPMDSFSLCGALEDTGGPAFTSRFPAFRRASSLSATLREGDVLWLPKFWWHLVRQPDAIGLPPTSAAFH